MKVEFDTTEMGSLIADLEQADRTVVRNLRKAVEVSARNVKDAWSKKAARSGLKGYAASVDYTVKRNAAFGGASVDAEIGPNLSRRRKLAAFGFVEEGGGGVRSAPQHAGREALKETEADFVKGVGIAAGEAMLGDS